MQNKKGQSHIFWWTHGNLLIYIHTSQLRCVLWSEIKYKHTCDTHLQGLKDYINEFLRPFFAPFFYPSTTRPVIFRPVHNRPYTSFTYLNDGWTSLCTNLWFQVLRSTTICTFNIIYFQQQKGYLCMNNIVVIDPYNGNVFGLNLMYY